MRSLQPATRHPDQPAAHQARADQVAAGRARHPVEPGADGDAGAGRDCVCAGGLAASVAPADCGDSRAVRAGLDVSRPADHAGGNGCDVYRTGQAMVWRAVRDAASPARADAARVGPADAAVAAAGHPASRAGHPAVCELPHPRRQWATTRGDGHANRSMAALCRSAVGGLRPARQGALLALLRAGGAQPVRVEPAGVRLGLLPDVRSHCAGRGADCVTEAPLLRCVRRLAGPASGRLARGDERTVRDRVGPADEGAVADVNAVVLARPHYCGGACGA